MDNTAASRYLMLGTNAEYLTRGARRMEASRGAASDSWGMARGFTKLVTSMCRSPVPESMSTNVRFTLVSIGCGSFCRPSRGPTSTMRTHSPFPSCAPVEVAHLIWKSAGRDIGRPMQTYGVETVIVNILCHLREAINLGGNLLKKAW